MKHGVYASEQASSVLVPNVAASGIPYVIGTAPVHAGATATPGDPVICTSWEEAVEKLGYSDDWSTYTLCEFMYAYFKLYGCQPAIFCNILDVSTHKKAEDAKSYPVVNHQVILPIDALKTSALVVKTGVNAQTALEEDTDYEAYYSVDGLIIELLSTGSAYSATTLSVGYDAVDITKVESDDIAAGISAIDLCGQRVGVIPDLVLAPGFSKDTEIAALMRAKAQSINSLMSAHTIIDIDSADADSYEDAISAKDTEHMYGDKTAVVWPCFRLGRKIFHGSTHLACVMARVDTENGGVPYASPSNHTAEIDGLCLADGTEVNLTLDQANLLNGAGIVTAINFLSGWTIWGNYNSCYPMTTDVKDYFIPLSRMFSWVGNTLIKTFWSQIDRPMNRRLIETVEDSANIWLNGLKGAQYLLDAHVAILESENPEQNLMAGIIKLHIYLTPASPAQEIDFVLEYDASAVTEALLG